MTGEAALERALVNDYDVVVLDRDVPKVHGDDACARLVEAGRRSRVLMLTAAGTVADRVDGLGLGADNYLPKPFAFAELVGSVYRPWPARCHPRSPRCSVTATSRSTAPGTSPSGAGASSASARRSSAF